MEKKIAVFLLIIILCMPISAMATDVFHDGSYTIEVNLSGGSGRSSVETPCEFIISEGKMTATIIWSSPYYTYMLIDEVYYYPINEEGNSTFEIPVTVFDQDIAISAETQAMSEPHVIDYTLYFDSSSLKAVGQKNNTVMIIVITVVILAGILAIVQIIVKSKKLTEDRS